MVLGEPQIVSQVKNAWAQAQKTGSSGRFLDAVVQKALRVAKRVRNETAIGNSAVSVPYPAVELAKQILGTRENKKVLLMGPGKRSELSAVTSSTMARARYASSIAHLNMRRNWQVS